MPTQDLTPITSAAAKDFAELEWSGRIFRFTSSNNQDLSALVELIDRIPPLLPREWRAALRRPIRTSMQELDARSWGVLKGVAKRVELRALASRFDEYPPSGRVDLSTVRSPMDLLTDQQQRSKEILEPFWSRIQNSGATSLEDAQQFMSQWVEQKPESRKWFAGRAPSPFPEVLALALHGGRILEAELRSSGPDAHPGAHAERLLIHRLKRKGMNLADPDLCFVISVQSCKMCSAFLCHERHFGEASTLTSALGPFVYYLQEDLGPRAQNNFLSQSCAERERFGWKNLPQGEAQLLSPNKTVPNRR